MTHPRHLRILAFALFCLAGSASAQQAMSFEYIRQTIYASGNIEPNSATQLREFAKRNHIPEGTTVALNSAGGSLLGGIRLGQLIRELNYDTNVYRYTGAAKISGKDHINDMLAQLDEDQPADCSSACVYAYVGGMHRELASESRLGIHQFYFPKNEEKSTAGDVQVLSAVIVAHLSQMGAKPELFSATTLFDSNSIHYLSRPEAENYGIVNHGILRMKFSYGVSLGRPYPQLSYQAAGNKFTLALLCNGDTLHIGASRELAKHNLLSADDDVFYFFLDDKPYFKMDRHKDSFHHEVDDSFLRKLFDSRTVQTWEEEGHINLDGGRFRVEDWEPFADYAKTCKPS